MDSRIFVLSCVLNIVWCQQDIRLPPSITNQDKSTLRYYGVPTYDGVTLVCDADGTPPPVYEWTYNDSEWNYPVSTIIPTPNSGNRTFVSFARKDEGTYRCYARNKYGRTMTQIIELAAADIGKFSNTGEWQEVHKQAGESVKLECDKPDSEPAASITWNTVVSLAVDQTGAQVPLSKRIQIDDDGNLVFSNLVKSDENEDKFYRCNIINTKAGFSAFGSYHLLHIEESDVTEIEPEIISYTGEREKGGVVVALKHDQVTLRCIFAGLPTPEVKWVRTDKQRIPDERTEIDGYGTELTIKNLEDDDEAIYRCIGTSQGVGSGHRDITLQIQTKPALKVGLMPTNQNKTNGDDAVFRCVADAEPPAIITWYKNTIPITDETITYKMRIEDKRTTLRVTDVCKDPCKSYDSDLSVYSCEASNIHGTDFASGYLNVLLPTILTGRPLNYTLHENATMDGDLEFTCSAKTDDSTPLTVVWLYNGRKFKIDGRLYRTAMVKNTNTLLISLAAIKSDNTSDIRNFIGNYTCKMSNGYTHVEATGILFYTNRADPSVSVAAGSWWWLILLVVVLLFFIITLIFCCLWCRKNRGEEYDVDEKERWNGNDPDSELVNTGYHEYYRPPVEAVKGSRASLNSTMKLDEVEEEGAGMSDLEYNTLQFNYQY